MASDDFVLELVKEFRPMSLLAMLAALQIYRDLQDEIKKLLGRIKSTKFPGGEVEFQSQKNLVDEAAGEDPPRVEVPEKELKELPEKHAPTLTDEDWERIRQLFRTERATARFWEYRYLNLFLVPRTVMILNWLSSTTDPVTTDLYHAFLPALWELHDLEERQAILTALESHFLISKESGVITVSPKGREYLAWRAAIIASAAS